MDNINNNFCFAAWFGARLSDDGHFLPCCSIRPEETEYTGQSKYHKDSSSVEEYRRSPYHHWLREQISQGNPVKECRRCWEPEEQGLSSFRTLSNKSLDRYPLNKKLLDKIVGKELPLMFMDLDLSNACNFACAMCNTGNSTKISHEHLKTPSDLFDTTKTMYYDEIDYLDKIPTKHLRNLKVIGGEPLVNRKLLKKLQQFPQDVKEKTELIFVTNGSKNLVDYAEQTGFRRITFSISIDAFGKGNDYVRKHSNWDTIVKHTLEAKLKYDVSIITTLQPLGIFGVSDLINWCVKNNVIHEFFGKVEVPDYLGFNSFPDELMELVKESLPSDIFAYINKNRKYDPQLWIKFKKFVEWYDVTSKQKLLDVYPQFKEVWNI